MSDPSAPRANGILTRAAAVITKTIKQVTRMAVVITDEGEERTSVDPRVMTHSAAKRVVEECRRRSASGTGQGGGQKSVRTPQTAEYPDKIAQDDSVVATARNPDGSSGYVQDQASTQRAEQPLAGSRQTGPPTVSTSEAGAI